MPDDIRVGGMVREIKGEWKAFDLERDIYFTRAQGNYRINDKLEGFVRLDSTRGKTGTSQYFIRGKVKGYIESFGAGISYFPFSKNFSFDLGTEIFYADVDIDGKFNLAKISFDDSFFGFGANAGITREIPLSDNFSIVASGGYMLTDNKSKYINFDFDSLYGFVGLKLALGK